MTTQTDWDAPLPGRQLDPGKPLIDLPEYPTGMPGWEHGMQWWRDPNCGRGRVFKGNVRQEAAEATGHVCGDEFAVVTGWDNTDAGQAKARRDHLERVLPRHVTEVLRQLQRIGEVERAVDTILIDGFPALNQMHLPAVDVAEDGEWWEEELTFPATVPSVLLDHDVQEAIRQKLVYMRGMLGLRSDALGQCLTKLLTDAQTAGISVPTTLDPVTPQDIQA